MAIYINGIKVAGNGKMPPTPYEIALQGGFSGSEQKFNDSLGKISDISNKIDGVTDKIDNVNENLDEIMTNQDFIAEYGITLLSAVQNALQEKKNIFVKISSYDLENGSKNIYYHLPLSSCKFNNENNLIEVCFEAPNYMHISKIIYNSKEHEENNNGWRINTPMIINEASDINGTESSLRGIIVSSNEPPTNEVSDIGNNGDIWIVYSN